MTESIENIMRGFKVNSLQLNESYDQFLSDVAPSLKKATRRVLQGGEKPELLAAKVIRLLDKMGFKKLGSGSFRVVFAHPSRPEVVLKVTHQKQGFAQNVKEAEVGRKNHLGGLFTKVYEADENGLWLIAERVEVIDSYSQFHNYIIPELYAVMRKWKIRDSVRGLRAMMDATKMTMVYMENFIKHKRVRYNQIPEFLHKRFGPALYNVFAPRGKHSQFITAMETGEVPQEFVHYIKECVSEGMNKFLNKVFKASLEFDMEVWDIRPDNVGISYVTKEPVLLDSALEIDTVDLGARGWSSRDTADIAQGSHTAATLKPGISVPKSQDLGDFEVVRESVDWENNFESSAKIFFRESSKVRHVDVVLDAIENLKNVLGNDKRFIRIRENKEGRETDIEVFLNVGQNNFEVVGQVAFDEHGFPIDDGSAWLDTSDFTERIKKYVEKLNKEKGLTEDGGGDGAGMGDVAVGSEITSGEGIHEPLSTKGYTYWSTKKNKKNSPAGTFTSKGGNNYKTYKE